MKNLMEKNKVLFVAIAFAAISLALVLYIANIWQGFHYLMGVFSPIIIGAGLAFVFNVPMKKLEGQLRAWKVKPGLQRPLAMLLVLLLLCLIFAGVVAIIVPTLATSVNSLTHTVQAAVPQLGSWLAATGLVNRDQLQDISNPNYSYLKQLRVNS